MSDEAAYIRNRLDDVLKGQSRLEDKIDRMRDEQVIQKSDILTSRSRLKEHHKLLVLGNGQKSLTVQVAEAMTRLEDVENDITAVRGSGPCDPADARKERLLNWGKVIGIVGIVVSQVLTWILAVPGGR